MNGEGEVNRTACIVGFNGNCSKTLTIKVKNCREYNVYHLVPVPQTSTGYCIGFNESFVISQCLFILQSKLQKEQTLFTQQVHLIVSCFYLIQCITILQMGFNLTVLHIIEYLPFNFDEKITNFNSNRHSALYVLSKWIHFDMINHISNICL